MHLTILRHLIKSQAREDTIGEKSLVRIFWQQITSDLHTYKC